MKIRCLFTALICLFLLASVSAQNPASRLSRRAKARANANVNSRVDRAVDKAVDDAIGSLFKRSQKKTADDQTSAPVESQTKVDSTPPYSPSQMLKMFNQDWEPYTNPREMSFGSTYVITDKKGKVTEMDMQMVVVEKQLGYLVTSSEEKDMASMRMILDTQTGKTIMIQTDKQGQVEANAMMMPNLRGMMEAQMEEEMNENDIIVTRTGQRQRVNGYNCEKITIENTKKGDTFTGWITNDLDLSMEDLFRPMMGFAGGQSAMPATTKVFQGLTGVVIKGTSVSDGETTDIEYRNFKLDGATDKSILDISGIEVQEMRFN
ncbi:MAG: DUF4412 domain-containing protein [Bacteroidota bacterium]